MLVENSIALVPFTHPLFLHQGSHVIKGDWGSRCFLIAANFTTLKYWLFIFSYTCSCYTRHLTFEQVLGYSVRFPAKQRKFPKRGISLVLFAFLTIFFVCGFAIIGYIAHLRSPSKKKRSKKKKTAWWSRPDRSQTHFLYLNCFNFLFLLNTVKQAISYRSPRIIPSNSVH